MSNALDRYTGGGAVGRPSQAPDLGASLSTAGMEWGGRVLGWADLPSGVQDAHTGHVLAEGANRLDGKALRVNGELHQVANAWRAFTDRLVLVTLVRPLQRNPDGRLTPVGGWRVHETATRQAVGLPTRTRGSFATGRAITGNDPGTIEDTHVRPEHANAAGVFAYLPALVRATVVKAVPTPDVWLGELVRWTTAGSPQIEQELVMLRLTDNAAVVVKATREGKGDLAKTAWLVDQYTYSLAPVRARIGRG